MINKYCCKFKAQYQNCFYYFKFDKVKLIPLAHSSFQDRRFKIAFTLWWIAWICTQAAVMVGFGINLKQALVDSITSNLLLAAICLLISNNMRYYLPRKEKYWYVLTLSLVLSGLWLLLVRIALWAFYKEDVSYLIQLQNTSLLRYTMAFLMIAAMAVINLLWHTQREQQQTDERKAEAERLSKDAELFKLRQQLQPHFLFNSLNSIAALTGTQPEKARHMIQQLSDFLRGTVKKEDQQWITLEDELQHLQLYLDIEKVRFGYRLQTQIHIAEQALQWRLPSLLLQPIVENAIKFGLYDTIGEVVISIDASIENDMLQIVVQNPFDQATASSIKGTGFGLTSIQRRLFLLFARQDLLHTHHEQGQFVTTLSVPAIN